MLMGSWDKDADVLGGLGFHTADHISQFPRVPHMPFLHLESHGAAGAGRGGYYTSLHVFLNFGCFAH